MSWLKKAAGVSPSNIDLIIMLSVNENGSRGN